MLNTGEAHGTLPLGRDDLEAVSIQTRRLIVESVHRAGAGHLGGPMSATDLLVHLYFNRLRIDPSRPDWPESRSRYRRRRFTVSPPTPPMPRRSRASMRQRDGQVSIR